MFYYHIDVCTGLSESIILISIDDVPTLYQYKYSIPSTAYLHSLDIFKMMYIKVDQMLIYFE